MLGRHEEDCSAAAMTKMRPNKFDLLTFDFDMTLGYTVISNENILFEMLKTTFYH